MPKSRVIHIAQPDTGEEEWQALREPIMSGWLTQGPKVAEFERTFAEIHQVKHAIATTSCTTALHLVLASMGIAPGDEVIVPAFTWVATANVVLYCGAIPVFVDVDRDTFNVDPDQIASKVTPNTKAIIVVHLFGLCADVDAIAAAAPGIPIIEDAACAAGASYKGRAAGSLGLAAAFSFHPRKSITTGEGGMVTTNDDELAKLASSLRNHGAEISEEQRHHGSRPYLLPEFKLLGFNYRMTDLQGAVGLVQLKKLKCLLTERDKWASYYSEELKSLAWLNTPRVPEACVHGWQSYVCYIDRKQLQKPRNELMSLLYASGINTRPGTHSVPTLEYYSERFGFKPDDYPASHDCETNSIALPLHNKMTQEDFRYVVDAIRRI